MARKAPATEYQAPGVCSWCGHDHKPRQTCLELIKVAAGPSGGAGRPVPTKTIPCPCRRKEAAA